MIIVIGKSGQLATEIALQLTTDECRCLGRDDIDLYDESKALAVLSGIASISGVINASAYTAVDRAETEQDAANTLNHLAPAFLAKFCTQRQIPFVHVSTDYVFDGMQGKPYQVNDKRNPQGVYGATKALGEEAIEALHSEHTAIIRTSWVYSVHGANFVKTMLRLMAEKPALSIVADQIGSPTSARALAKACIQAINSKLSGVHHFTDAGVASWYDFAYEIHKQGLALGVLDKAIPLSPITTKDYPTPASRPHYSVLDKSTLADALPSITLRHWTDELADVISELKNA